MTYDVAVEIAWKSCVTSGIALLLLQALKHRSAAERSWIAHAGLAATLLLLGGATLLPRWHVASPVPAPAIPAADGALSSASPAAAPLAELAAAEAAIDFSSLALYAYAAIASALLLVVLVAVLRLFLLRRNAQVLVAPGWLGALAHAQRRMGFKHGTALLVSDELRSPVSWGVIRPIILLNEQAVTSGREAEAIIAHELAHVANFDWAKLILARAATALFWFNPLVWLLARQCHQLREEAADDAVLLGNVPSTDYAALLIGAARHDNRPLLLAANGVAPGKSSLKRRVTRVLDGTLPRAPARVAWGAACTLAVAAVAGPLAALTTEPPVAAEVEPAASPQPVPLLTPSSVPAVAAAGASARAAAPLRLAESAQPSSLPAAPDAVALARLALKEGPAKRVEQMAVRAAEDMLRDPAVSLPAPLALAQSDRPLPPETLMQMRIHGVDADYIRDMASAGFSRLTAEQLVAMRIQGVSPQKMRELTELGYGGLSTRDLVSASVHGVSPSYIRSLADAGYRGLSIEELTAMRIHGVSAAFARDMAAAGFTRLSPEQLMSLRMHGVTGEYIRDMAAAGYRLDPKQAINMRALGQRALKRNRKAPPPPPLPRPPLSPEPPPR